MNHSKTGLIHNSVPGTAGFDLEGEFDGMRHLIVFWLLWAVFNNQQAVVNALLLVDEPDSSLYECG